jgi:acyl-coenzyme A synthetase/AMP-(fatty) acid ligase
MMGFSTIVGSTVPLTAHSQGVVLCYAGSTAEALQMINLFGVAGLVLSVGQLQPFFALLGNQPPPRTLKFMAIVGAKISAAQLTEARARICNTVIFGYGSTEMGGISLALSSTTDTPEGYAGHVMPWIDVEVVDEDRRPLPPGREGLLRVRPPELAYYVDAEGKAVDMLEDGWFYPGDIGALDTRGALRITGRSSEVLNRGGMIVAPDVIEDVLRLDKRIRDVAVVGVPNAQGIEEIWAAVVSDTLIDPKAIADAARPRLNEKLPDRIIQVNAIPRAESAKVKRNELREILKARA